MLTAVDQDVVVQPGISWIALREALAPRGLFFPPDPGAAACIGGMCGTNCSGTLAYRYGTMKDNVLSLRVVLADGSVVVTRRRAVKSSAGYDLTRLFIGSEGTLGVVTQATLRLRRIPKHTTVVLAQFETLRAAAAAVHRLVLSGVAYERLEILDGDFLRALAVFERLQQHSPADTANSDNASSTPRPFPFEARPALLVQCAAHLPGALQDQVDALLPALKAARPSLLRVAASDHEAARLFDIRRRAYLAGPLLRADSGLAGAAGIPVVAAEAITRVSTDVAVPVSRLADAMDAARALIAEEGLVGPIVAHAGDGNFHCLLLVRHDNEAEAAAAERVKVRLADVALAMDGTITGEHGVGFTKRALFEKEADPAALALMRLIKKRLDPRAILNPGKVLAPEDASAAVTATAAAAHSRL
ncbi:hypothetical protein HK405_014831 [Cladochytrium tenue]|nr:hypothetical protein HK405_014831 [Cladochytrium tenue]